MGFILRETLEKKEKTKSKVILVLNKVPCHKYLSVA